MRCPIETQEHAELLLAYCSRKLNAANSASIEDHLRSCPACREFAGGQQAVWNALDSWEAPPVSPDFDQRLYQRIEQDVPWWDRFFRPFRPVLFRQGLPIAAAAGVLIIASLWIERPGQTPEPPAPASAQMETIGPDQAQHALDDMEMMREFNSLMHPDAAEPKM